MLFNYRTHTCGELREKHVGEKVVLNGWVDSERNLGGVLFINLRDRYGVTQTVIEPGDNSELFDIAKPIRSEFVLAIEGTVRKRPDGTINEKMTTGHVDVLIEKLDILNPADTPPFVIKDDVDATDELKLKYRYLDLRRNEMQRNMLLRHKMALIARNYLTDKNFIEVETPVLMKSTPEGARDFLVPSRINKGRFYALPQSPQTYKQLLMVSGFDRYFQIVKCFRDEDLRADRQLEFTQIDIEMSFVDIPQIFELVEGMMKTFFSEIKGYDLELPIPRLSYQEAMEKYGSDKPDLRFGLEMTTMNEKLKGSGFKVFSDTINNNGIITAIKAEGCAEYSRKQLDTLTDLAKKHGAGGLVWIKLKEDGFNSPIAKFLTDEEKENIVSTLDARTGDLLLMIAGNTTTSLNAMGAVRLEMAKRMELVKPDSKPALLWVTDFPLFEWDEETERYYAMHHPFTSPNFEDVEYMESDPGKVRARAYDLVLNGHEVAGGSIRIHDSALQQKMFRALGISDEEAKEKFGFLMNAFRFGAPPHGGIAFGFDRLVMIFAGEQSIREVIAFPKTTSGISLMDDSPAGVADEQLKELHIKLDI